MFKGIIALIIGVVMSFAASAGCTAPNQDGCFNIVAVNALWDEHNPAMAGLDKPAANLEEASRRMNEVGRAIFDGYKHEKVRAAKSHKYLLLLWNMDQVPVTELGSYQMKVENGRGVVVPGKVEEVDPNTVALPTFDPSNNLGKPAAVYRIHANGFDGSLQIPWSAAKDGFTFLICQEDEDGIYPFTGVKGSKQGHWATKESLDSLKDKNARGQIFPFISRI